MDVKRLLEISIGDMLMDLVAETEVIGANAIVSEFDQAELREHQEWQRDQIIKRDNALTAEVAALRARVAELEQAARWVSVDQRLPDVEEHVLTIYWTFGGGSAATIRALLDTGMWFDCGSGYLCPPNNVTHWRPLPTPPEAE